MCSEKAAKTVNKALGPQKKLSFSQNVGSCIQFCMGNSIIYPWMDTEARLMKISLEIRISLKQI